LICSIDQQKTGQTFSSASGSSCSLLKKWRLPHLPSVFLLITMLTLLTWIWYSISISVLLVMTVSFNCRILYLLSVMVITSHTLITIQSELLNVAVIFMLETAIHFLNIFSFSL